MDTKRVLCVVVSCFLITGISSCSRSPCEKYLKNPPYVKPIQLVKVKKPLDLLQRREYDVCVLKRDGVQVIRLGQTWKLVFPGEALFENDTAEINDSYKKVLDVAADFMKSYPKIAVKVAAFSNKSEDDVQTKFGSVTDQLTERQAANVSHYFTSKKINARLIYAVGRGAHKPVAWDGSEHGRYFNRRVEVTFRYYRDNTAWY